MVPSISAFWSSWSGAVASRLAEVKFPALVGAALAIFVFWDATGALPRLGAPASAGDCVQIDVWNNGFHTDLTFPAALLAPDHPLRRLDPRARYLLVGWGDEDFFRSDGTNLLLGAKALLPGGATTMHVVYGDQPIGNFYIGENITPLAISREGMAKLAHDLGETLWLDADGRAQVIAPGHGGPRSWFLKARGEFDLFQVCNQWTARLLRGAGVNINAAFLYTGDLLVWAIQGARHTCPASGVLAPLLER